MKKGISLIVLVITIIVMIVLAGAIILSLNNAGIIEKSNEAVDLTNIANVREFAQTKWAEAYLETDKTQEKLEEYVLAELTEAGINKDDYEIEVTEKGVTVNKKGEVKIIKFKINEVEFQAEEGMSWVQWAASSYNTIGLKCTEEGCPYYDIDETTYHELGAYFDPVTGTYSYAEGIPVRGNSMKGKYKITAGADYNVNVGEYV